MLYWEYGLSRGWAFSWRNFRTPHSLITPCYVTRCASLCSWNTCRCRQLAVSDDPTRWQVLRLTEQDPLWSRTRIWQAIYIESEWCSVLPFANIWWVFFWLNMLPCFIRLQVVIDRCQGRKSCSFKVHHRLFHRDPCPRISKYLEVTYQCWPGWRM